MPSAPLSLRLTGYGLLGLLVQVPFTGTHTSLWMLAVCAAGGLVLDGLDELLRLPTPLRAVGLVLGIYALGNGAGWAVEQLGGECPWAVTAPGRLVQHGYVRLDHAPLWFGLALTIRPFRKGLDRLHVALASPAAARTAEHERSLSTERSTPSGI
jgi:hypothetical protein